MSRAPSWRYILEHEVHLRVPLSERPNDDRDDLGEGAAPRTGQPTAQIPFDTTAYLYSALLLPARRRRESRVNTSAAAATDSTASAMTAAAMVIAVGSACIDCSAVDAAGPLTQDDDGVPAESSGARVLEAAIPRRGEGTALHAGLHDEAAAWPGGRGDAAPPRARSPPCLAAHPAAVASPRRARVPC